MNDQVTTNETSMNLQDIEARSFGVAELEDANKYVNKVVEVCLESDIEPIFNFDTNEELPAGYGLAVIPLTKRVTGLGNVTTGVCIAAIPTVDAILQAETGDSWVRKQITSILVRAVKLGATSSDEEQATALPFSITDFIVSSRSSALAAFNAIASLYVKALKDKGLKFINKTLLRQVLASAAFAEQQFPKITQDNWELVLKAMIAHAAKDGMDAGILAFWLKTRNEVEVDATDIDLSDIEGMVTKEEEPAAA